jgi:lantibiotic modifying enzyme
MNPSAAPAPPAAPGAPADVPPPLFLHAAATLGHRVCGGALRDGGGWAWEGPLPWQEAGEWGWRTRPLGADLYSGTAGIALFLARLYAATGEAAFRDAALGAMSHAVTHLHELPPAGLLGLYTGLPGIALGAAEVGVAVGEERWVEMGRRLMLAAAAVDPGERPLDVMAGAAGAVAGLACFARRYGGEPLLDAAGTLAAFLESRAVRRDGEWSWAMPGGLAAPGEAPLSGLAHGTGGIAWALLELYEATGEPRWGEAARAGLRYEARRFCPVHRNWPDLRGLREDDPVPADRYLVQWCYGAGGMAHVLLRAVAVLGDEDDPLAAAALETVAEEVRAWPENRQPNFSLCHGMGGNAEALLHGASIMGRPDLLELARTAGRLGWERYGETGEPWPSGVQHARETPSLMWGMSGTGLFYLRLHDPSSAPPATLFTAAWQ